MLEVKNLIVTVNDKIILDNFNLKINDQEIHALMGPNGTGKSTISKVLLHDNTYTIKKGKIIFENEDITKLSTSERALKGIYLVSQNPMQIEGVSTAEMLRTALNDQKDYNINIFDFRKELDTICDELELPREYVHRDINVGMSGGERKKLELVHLWMLKPKFIILDEIDSGLDIDALQVVAKSLKKYYNQYHPGILIVTHHVKILEYLKPDKVHILKEGKIKQTGDYKLALEIEKAGFQSLSEANIVGRQEDGE